MDMQPIAPAPEAKGVDDNTKSNQPRNHSAKGISRAVLAGTAGDSYDDDPPLLMMASMNSETSCEHDAIMMAGYQSSPSKCLLLQDNSSSDKGGKGHSNNRASKKHTKRASKTNSNHHHHNNNSSNKSVGKVSKLSRAIFGNKGNFSKMKNDDTKLKRSPRSSFSPIEPASSNNRDASHATAFSRVVASMPSDEQLSFDNTSTHSDDNVDIEEPFDSPNQNKNKSKDVSFADLRAAKNNQNTKQQQQQIKGPIVEIDRSSPCANTNNLSALTMSDVGSMKSASQTKHTQQRTMATDDMPATAITTASKAPSVSSLNYSVSQASSRVNNNKLTRSGSTGSSIKTEAETFSHDRHHTATESIIEDLDSSMSEIMQERLLDRLDQVASNNTTPTAAASTAPASPSAAKHSKQILPLKPPPSLPPKAPRHHKPSSGLSASREQHQQQLREKEEARILKQCEARLLKGGDFLNESASTTVSGSSADLAMKLLSRLEAANADHELMKDHHDQDPPLVMTTSFGSSTVMLNARRPSSGSSSGTLPRLPSNSSSSNATNPYAAFMAGNELPMEDHSHSRSAASGSVAGFGDTYQHKRSKATAEDDDDSKSAPKINYLYSQDNEFENSILSPQSVYSNSRAGSAGAGVEDKPGPRSPKNLYRSDAINAFLEKADCMGPEKQTIGSPARNQQHVTSTASLVDNADDDDDSSPVEEGPKIVSEEFLNIVTSGCTGAPNPAAKEAIAEKLVALEAGWSGFRTQVNDKMQGLEESWQNWNLNSLLQFSSPNKNAAGDEDAKADAAPGQPAAACVTTPTGSTTVLTTPPSMSTAKQQQMAQIRASRTGVVTPKAMFPEDPFHAVECTLDGTAAAVVDSSNPMNTSQDEIILGVVKELRSSKYHKEAECGTEVEKIVIGSTEQDVPLSLKNTLADISMIDDANCNSSSEGAPAGHNIKNHHQHQPCLNSSREDSEGGKIVLDAAEWDPVEASDAEVHVDLSADPIKQDGFFYKHKNGGKVLRSPTSVLVEI